MIAQVKSASLYEAPQIQLQGYDALTSPIIWWIVLIIVLLALAAIVATAVIIWCVSHGGGYVVKWSQSGSFPYNVSIGCSK